MERPIFLFLVYPFAIKAMYSNMITSNNLDNFLRSINRSDAENNPRILSSKSYGSCLMEKTYIPSIAENYWKTNIEIISKETIKTNTLSNWNVGCRSSNLFMSNITSVWMTYWKLRESQASKLDIGIEEYENDLNLFSEFRIAQSCENSTHHKSIHRIPIEPLFGALRHPLTCGSNEKFDEQYVLNKDYMIPVFKNEIFPHLIPGISKCFLFDLGASLYTEGAGGASQSWFVDTYTNRGIFFDRILAWEAAPHPPKEIFDQYPQFALSVISYFNIPASTSTTSIQNPLNILKYACREKDFVVLKIDIDNSKVEMEFIAQILADDSISSLIDEMYFEHHVGLSPMANHGWGGTIDGDIMQSYQLFTNLRRKGIRAHSWV